MKMIGSVNDYTKNLALTQKWQKRVKEQKSTKDPRIEEMEKQMKEIRRGQRLSGIMTKAKSGSKLTPDELSYLRTHSPDDYDRVVRAQREREDYKKQLSRCKSKEDVDKLKQQKLSSFVTEANTISRSSTISDAKKQELLDEIAMRMAGILKEDAEFKKTAGYQMLPETSKESDKARRKSPRGGTGNSIEQDIPQQPKDIQAKLAELYEGARDRIQEKIDAASPPRTYDVQGQLVANTIAQNDNDSKVSIDV